MFTHLYNRSITHSIIKYTGIGLALFIFWTPHYAEAFSFSNFFTEVKNPDVTPITNLNTGTNVSTGNQSGGSIVPPTTTNCFNGFCKNTSPFCALSTIFTRTITLGAYGTDVVALQDFLIGRGFLTMSAASAKGYFGPKTAAALIRYQGSIQLPPTGSLDTTLANRLNSDVATAAACLTYSKYDRLSLSFKKGVSVGSIARQMNNLGFISEGGLPLCSTDTVRSTCLNGYRGLFTLIIPSQTNIAKVASKLASLDIFNTVSYVPATLDYISRTPYLSKPAYTAISSSTKVVDIGVDPNTSTTVTTTTYSLSSTVAGSDPTQHDINIATLNMRIAPDSFVYGTWTLSSASGVSVVPSITNKAIVLNITKDNAGASYVSINACNTATTTATIYGDVMSAHLPAAAISCNPYLDGYEAELRAALSDTANFTITGNILRTSTLEIVNANNKARYQFVRS